MLNDQKVCNAIGQPPPVPLKTKHNFFGKNDEIYALVSAHTHTARTQPKWLQRVH